MRRARTFILNITLVSMAVVLLFGFSPRVASRQQGQGQAEKAADQYRAVKLAQLRGEAFVDGTAIDGSTENRFMEEKLRHERNMKRVERLRRHGAALRRDALQADIGDIAVIEDDGRLIVPANLFDLKESTVILTRTADGQYVVGSVPETYTDFRSDLGTKLTQFRGSQVPEDDGFAQVDLDFSFPFFNNRYDRMFVGTNGYITFGRGDATPQGQVTRFLIRPRIAALWEDLDLSRLRNSSSAGIFVKQLVDRVVVTYRFVPRFGTNEFNTFQVTLLDSGQILMSYSRQIRTNSALVGISPGRTSRQAVVDLNDAPGEKMGSAIFEIFRDLAEVDVLAVPSVFFETHSDDFDFVYIWTDFSFDLGNALAFYLGTRNESQGIGERLFDRSGAFGSAGQLQGVLVMNNIFIYPPDPAAPFFRLDSSLSILGQEQGHRWLAFIGFPGDDPTLLLGRQNAHWNFFFNTESTESFSEPTAPRASSMEGNVWIDNGDGTFSTPGNERTGGYSSLDLYLMGLRAPEEVDDSFVIADPNVNSPMLSRGLSPRADVTVQGTRVEVTIDDVIEANGPRVPGVEDSQKEFRAAFILLVQAGTTPSEQTLEKLNLFRAAWENYFHQATDNRGRIVTRLSN